MLTSALRILVTALAKPIHHRSAAGRALGFTLTAVTLSLCAPGQAHADEEGRAQARRHFARGVELLGEGAYGEAVVEFGRAYELSPHYSVLYNIGQAYIALGRPVEAVDTLTRYLVEGAGKVPSDRQKAVEAEVQRLRSRIAELEITTNIPDSTIWIDGLLVGKAPLSGPARVGIGRHQIAVQSENGARAEQVIQVAGEERRRIALDAPGQAPAPPRVRPAVLPTPVASPPPVAPAAHHESTHVKSTFGYVLGGLGIALGGAAVGHFLWNKARYEDWRARYSELAKEPDDGAQDTNNALARSIDRASAVTVGLTIGAGVALGTGFVLILTDGDSARKASGFVAWRGLW